jgi:hypothetical protein
MSTDTSASTNPPAPNPLAELLRENERLRQQLDSTQHERDAFKALYLGELAKIPPELTPEDLANAVPARPFIEQLIQRLEKR